jgi:restriction system protein
MSPRSPWRAWTVRTALVYAAIALAAPAFGASAREHAAWPTLKTAIAWAAGALLVLGPLVYVGRRKRGPLDEPESSIQSIQRLSHPEFERVIGESFRLQGYGVEEQRSAKSRDGACLVLCKPGQRILVRCIHRTGAQVGVDAVRELHQLMSGEAASGGLIVTSEELTSDARAWVADKPIGLIEGRALLELVNRGRARRPRPAHLDLRREPYLGPPLAELLDCPLCGAPMVLKKREQPSHAELAFFGCSVPRCPGTRPA